MALAMAAAMPHFLRASRTYRESVMTDYSNDSRVETSSCDDAHVETQNFSLSPQTIWIQTYEKPLQSLGSNMRFTQNFTELENNPARALAPDRFRQWTKAIIRRRFKKEKPYLGPSIDEVLSPNLLLDVTKYLTQVERAALALTSKRIMSIMAKEDLSLNWDPSARLDLLSLLERDATNTTRIRRREILCRPCQTFHDPVCSVTAGDYDPKEEATDSAPPCIREITTDQRQRLRSPYLPRELHFNMVKAFMCSERNGTRSFDPRLLEWATIYGYRSEETKANVQQATTCRVSSTGDLLLKTTTRLFACRDSNEAKNNVRFVVKLLEDNNLTRCCKHVDWIKTYPFIFNYVGLPTDWNEVRAYRFSKRYDQDPMKKIRDIWNPAVKPRYAPKNHVWIMHCKSCYTNYEYEWMDTVDGCRIVFSYPIKIWEKAWT